ncbi:MAG: peptidase M23 [Oceanospirillales bacterium LUC14_002_19_P2]|nr:MAG: peptidase M23 [Oceanospirillales bacterium LUC14_002_19_P2]
MRRIKYLNVCSKNIMLLMLLFLIAACSHQQLDIPVSNRTRPETVLRGAHVVQPGETLFSIAWRYGQDYIRLASANRIRSPYVIYPGQRLSLSGRAPTTSSQPKTVAKASVSSPSKAAKTKVYKKEPVSAAKKKTDNHPVSSWRWPARGNVVSRFSSRGSVNKGIDIAGKIGEPVFATAAGEVVYAGSGLTGYGNLIIVKHNGSYLSAYAHNKVLLVREGSTVKAGQKIAEIGSTGTSEPKLHFEIRRNGKPVDPLLYLSKR